MIQNLRIESLNSFLYEEKEKGYLLSGQVSPMFELTYVDAGAIHCVAEGRDLLLEPGDMVLYGPNQWHMQYAEVEIAPCLATISFAVSGCDLQKLTNCKLHASQNAKEILQQLFKEQEQENVYSEDMIISLLKILVITLLRQDVQYWQIHPVAPINGENRIIERMQRYIAEHAREKLSVPVVAKNIQVSPSYLTALFQKHMQISPGEYLRRVKLQESKQMIQEGDKNFTEIAEALQYSTVYHFSRQFKEKFGITPSEYAKSVK